MNLMTQLPFKVYIVNEMVFASCLVNPCHISLLASS